MSAGTDLDRVARELKERYGDLLTPPRRDPDPEIEAAFDRLFAERFPPPAIDDRQMTLEMGPSA